MIKMNMKAKDRIVCACDEVGFEKYNVMITVPKEHPFGKKGMCDLDAAYFGVDVACVILDKVWKISFSRESFGSAIDDAKVVMKYLDDMLEMSKVVDQHDLLGALVIKVDMLGDDAWKITFRLKGGDVVEMYGDDEDHLIIYGSRNDN